MKPDTKSETSIEESAERRQALQRMHGLLSSERKPLVDIIVVNYNYARFLNECLQSVLAQDYENWHCTVVDDASTDESPSVIHQFVKAHPERFTGVFRTENGGQLAAMRSGFDASEGDFVVFLDSDDILFSNFITVHLAAHLYRFNVAFTCSQLAVINGRGQVISSCRTDVSHLQQQEYFTYFDAQPLIWLRWYWSAMSGMMFRRSVLTWSLPHDTSKFRICADHLLAQFANLAGGSLVMQEVLGYYRMHGGNQFSSPSIYGMNACHGNMRLHPSHRKDVAPTLTGLLLDHAEEMSATIGPVQWLHRFSLVAPLALYRAAFRMRANIGLSTGQLMMALIRRYIRNAGVVVRYLLPR